MLFMFCFGIVDVQAGNKLVRENLTLECIYTDGGLYTSVKDPEYGKKRTSDEDDGEQYDERNFEWSVNRTPYNVYGASKQEPKGDVTYLTDIGYDDANGTRMCHNIAIYSWFDSNEDHVEDRTVYMFGKQALEFLKAASDTSFGDWEKWYKARTFQFALADLIWNKVYDPAEKAEGKKNVEQGVSDVQDSWEVIQHRRPYYLVSERYILNSDIPNPNATIYYASKAEQAVGFF